MSSMLLLSSCSNYWSFPSKFTLCDVNLEYGVDNDDESIAQVRVGYCPTAEWLKKWKNERNK